MVDLMILAILVGIIGVSVAYIVREKKKGVHCIGCPSAGTCARRQAGCGCDHEK